MKASLIQPVRKEDGFKVINEKSNGEFVEIYTTNGVESINAKLKRCITFELPVEKFITAFKKIIDSQEHNTMKPLAEQVTSSLTCHSNI